MNKVDRAREKYEEAAKQLMQTVHEEYPIGTVVTIEIGRGRFPVEVVWHGEFWWLDPEILHGKNLNSGFVREFRPGDVVK